MTKTIPLKSGSKYTIYTLNTANRKPWKREITYLAVAESYKHFKAHRGTRIGRCYPRDSSVSLALISDLAEDIIIEGWDHGDVISTDANKLIIEGGFGVGFSLSLQNLNRNYTAYKSLYFLDSSKDSESIQVFPLQNRTQRKDISVERCSKLIKNLSVESTEPNDDPTEDYADIQPVTLEDFGDILKGLVVTPTEGGISLSLPKHGGKQ